MIALASGLLGGILIALAAPLSWQAGAFGAVATLALVAMLLRRPALAAGLVAGFVLAHGAALRVLDAVHDCGERRLVTARIDTIPAPQSSGWQYDAWVQPVAPPSHPPLRVRVTHPGALSPVRGERWQLLLQFDARTGGQSEDARRRALLRDHVSATGRVRESPLNRRLAPARFSIDTLRARVAQRIQARVEDPSAAALLAALAVGVTAEVSPLQWRVFSVTGITHLVAISGMHVTFFAMLCMGMARVLWRRWARLGAWCRRESFASGVGVLLAFGYALLSGFSVPAQRTALMLAAFLAARSCGREAGPMWSVAVALAAVLLWDPLAVLSAGFWLSFCAVASIILLAAGRAAQPGSLRAAALVQWVVTVALLPMTVVLFGTFSSVGPLVNAVAIPLFTFALVPPVLVATALYLLPVGVAGALADRLVDLAAGASQLAWPWLVRAAELPAASWSAQSSALWLLLAVPAVLCVLAPVPIGLRLGALALLGSALVPRAPRIGPGNLQVTVFDVGASRAVLFRTARHQLLVGSGESFGTAGRRFEREVLPQLLRGARVLDVLLLDRVDRDSLQALALAGSRLALRQIIAATPDPPPEMRACAAARWQWDAVSFELRASADGCWLAIRAGKRLLVTAPLRIGAASDLPDFGAASLLVLPRQSRAAATLMQRAAPDVLALASLSAGEWQSTGWRAVREVRHAGGQSLWSTSNLGSLRLLISAEGRLTRMDAAPRRLGIWSAAGAACGL